MTAGQRVIANATWLQWPEVQALADVFRKAGEELRFVGGCVRDALLSREVTEVDAATPARPERVTQLLTQAGIRAVPTGIEHGTVTAVQRALSIEITTLRRDVSCDGRHAEVEYGTDWAEDARRRDFTINALYADMSGQVFDYVDGLKDIAPLRLRFIGDAERRIAEDALRILRYFRFMAQLSVPEADAAALGACSAAAGSIARLSGERIAQEMRKLLSVPGLEARLPLLMAEAGILSPLLLHAPSEALARLLAIEAVEAVPPSWLRRLACWLRGDDAHPLIDRWKLSAAERDTLLMLSETPLLSPNLPILEQKALLRRLGPARFTDLVLLARAFSGNSAPFRPMLTLAQGWKVPDFPVKGEDLLAHGYEEGPAIGAMLRRLEEAWEAADYAPTREQLLARLPRR